MITPSLSVPPLGLVGQIDQCDPEKAVGQIIDLFLEIHNARKTELPQIASQISRNIIKDFKNNPANHVISRQFMWESYAFSIKLAARTEAKRRATQLLYYLHYQREQIGQWPESLDKIPRLPRQLRIDPFSGKDFCYRVENDNIFLYSVASNGGDDGGKHHHRWGEEREGITDTDYVLWPIPRKE